MWLVASEWRVRSSADVSQLALLGCGGEREVGRCDAIAAVAVVEYKELSPYNPPEGRVIDMVDLQRPIMDSG